MSTYLGHVQTVRKKFHQLLPLSTDIATQEKNYDKLFVLLTLAGLPDDMDSVRQQILASASIPSMEDVFARLLRVSQLVPASVVPINDASVLASQSSVNANAARSNTTGRGSRPRPHCTYCNKLGHTRERCFKLHGRPKSTTNVVQSESPVPSSDSPPAPHVTIPAAEYERYLAYQASNSSTTTSVA